MSVRDHLDDPDIDKLTSAILDGLPIDWTDPALPGDERLLGELRVVASIADLHRAPGPEPGGNAFARWGHLTLIEKLGEGSSGRVFLAVDNRLRRDVALKLLPSGSGVAAPADAVIEEASLLAKIRHPNVLTVFGAESHEGRVGIITEYIDGTTLSDFHRAQGALSAEDAVSIGTSLCRGLAAVHRAGLLHRDVTANNVMREKGGRIVLMDLGSGVDASAAAAGAAGTPIYAAPELLAGKAATAESDIYSLGVVLFHLVTGRYPVEGATMAVIRDAHAEGKRVSLRDLRPDLPPAFTSVVSRAVSPDPAARYKTAGEMELDLIAALGRDAPPEPMRPARRARRWLVTSAVATVTAACVWVAWRAPAPAGVPFEAREAVLIVPFENRSGSASLDGVLEHAVAHALSNSTYVNLVPRERVDDALMLMRRPITTPIDQSIGREIAIRDGRIRLLVTGGITKVGSVYPVTVSIIDVASGQPLASRREESTGDAGIPATLNQLAEWIRLTLGEPRPDVERGHRQLERVTTPSLAALRDYSDAFRASKRRDWGVAAALLESAVAKDPGFASAHIWLAWARLNLLQREQALHSAERAVALVTRASDRERHFILGSDLMLRGQLEAAASQFEALLAVHPDDHWGQDKLLQVYERLGRIAEARALALEFAATRPHDAVSQIHAARDLVLAEGIDAARPYVSRSSALLHAGAEVPAALRVFIMMFPAHELWLARRIAETSRALETAAGDPPITGLTEQGIRHLAAFRLTLGQLQEADRLLRLARPGPVTDIAFSLAALARNDHAYIRKRMRVYRGQDLASVSLLVRAGDLDAAEQLHRRFSRTEGRHDEFAVAEIAVGRGEMSAVRTLEAAIESMEFSGARRFLYAATLADALVRQGQTDRAIDVLAAQGQRPHRLLTQASHIGHLWLRNQHTLAQLYRAAGRAAEARTVERELLAALALADADHPILVALQKRAITP
ncbi:MAG: serine/threonine-protein kinase [Acidobacteriota bacterium]|nr:serine/threonine-protein kinase [Acidobacteriota bacterium]